MTTLTDLTEMTGRQVLDYLDLDAAIPTHDGLVAQGDITVIPEAMWQRCGIAFAPEGSWAEIKSQGVTVLAGMHDHVLVAAKSAAQWSTDVTDITDLAIGIVDVTTEAHLLHEEHGGIGLAPGKYALRASREQAAIIRRVAD